MGRRIQKPPGKCIFCGRTGLSKEHVWSDWIKEIVPRGAMHSEHSQGFTYDKATNTFDVTLPQNREFRQGCMSQRKVRNVCKSYCNNGWMGRAVDSSKPIAKKLMLGEECEFGKSEMTKLATWIGITTVMQEFTVSRTVMIPPEDRTSLMNAKAPPNSWSIWIGYYGGAKWQPMGHLHVPVTLSNRTSEEGGAISDLPQCNLQVTTFAIRRLLAHVFTATDPNVVATYREFVRHFQWNVVQLWPLALDEIAWPRFPILDNELHLILNEYVDTGLGLGQDFDLGS